MEGSCHSVNYHPLKVSGRGGFELGNSELWGKVRMRESYFLEGGYPECYLQSISFSFFKYFHLSFRQREISILSFNKCAPCDTKSGKLQKPGEGQKFHCGGWMSVLLGGAIFRGGRLPHLLPIPILRCKI